MNKVRFDLIMPAVVSQLECGTDYVEASRDRSSTSTVSEAGKTDTLTSAVGDRGVAACRRYAEELVGPCLAQLASVSAKDALWKALVNAVLLKTRSNRAAVRVAALVSLRQCFEVVGEEFLALLPECLPFLSELLEVRRVHLVLNVVCHKKCNWLRRNECILEYSLVIPTGSAPFAKAWY